MSFWERICGNEVLISAVIGWMVAQVLKTLIDFALNESFSAERLVGSGGMPSSHSSTVCALTTSAGIRYGVESFEFAICAPGNREAGKVAESDYGTGSFSSG